MKIFAHLCLRQLRQTTHNTDITTISTRNLWDKLDALFYHGEDSCLQKIQFHLSSTEKKTLEQFHAVLVGLVSRAACGDREEQWVCDMVTAHMINEKRSEKLLEETSAPKEAYNYAIWREKGIEHNRTIKPHSQGHTSVLGNPFIIKQEPMNYRTKNTPDRKR